ncbi:MAG: HAD family hydrolase [Desulfobacteraceae bacterium]|nr:HAD family hydrolase [Desulfobacteraceae bacterium]
MLATSPEFRAVLFDLDGTLLDTIEDLADSTNAALGVFGFPVHPIESYKYFVGEGMLNLVKKALPEHARNDPVTLDRAFATMKQCYAGSWAKKTRPYPGVPELLDALCERAIPMAVLSNKPHEFTVQMVEALLPRWRFAVVYGERAPVPRKPHPGGALEIASLLRIEPHHFLYAGDTGTDMLTANAAGMYAVGVLWGFRPAEELTGAGAKKLIKYPTELLGLL